VKRPERGVADARGAVLLASKPTHARPRYGAWRWFRQQHWTFAIGSTTLTIVALVLVLTPLIAPHDPAAQDLANRLHAPDLDHWLGTDHLGRDVLSRLMWGGRFSVTVAGVALVLCAVIGSLLGAIAARRGGWVDEVVMRTVDVLISFPDVVVALFLIALLGTGYSTLIVALMRGLALEINSKEYIEAAEILGTPKVHILIRHVIPNAMRPVMAMGFLRFGHLLITVGALSYLGLGVQPPDSDWGAMLLDARPYIERLPWLAILPGAAIFVTALSVTMIGQGLDLRRQRGRSNESAEAIAAAVVESKI
jgi:ABC-type dipeptide/oligopeptide/nickel transport system permease subunit